MKKLENWHKCITSFDRLNISDAKKMYKSIGEERDYKKRKQIRDKLIKGTLYVVYNFIVKNNFSYLNNNTYSMDDIISVCNELWITKIDEGKLLKVKTFNGIFDGEFYIEISKELISDHSIYNEDLGLHISYFNELLSLFIKQKSINNSFNYNNFVNMLHANNIDNHYLKYSIFDNRLSHIYILLEGIYESIFKDEKYLSISKTKLDKLKYLLISNGLEYVRQNINNVYTKDTTDNIVNKNYLENIIDMIFNNNIINEQEKEVLRKRWGIINGDLSTLEKVANNLKLTKERIRQIETKAFMKIKSSKQINELIKKGE